MQSSKPILFMDYNKVISYKNFWFSLEDSNHQLHKSLSDIEQYLFRNNPQLVKDWMVGKYTSEVVHELISREVGVDYTTLWDIFIRDCGNLDAPMEVLDSLQAARPYFFRILRTDNMDSFTRFTLPANKSLQAVFERVDNSFELGELKTDRGGAYFLETAECYRANIKDCYLIDDSEKNCLLFRSLGGRAIHVTGATNVAQAIQGLIKESV